MEGDEGDEDGPREEEKKRKEMSSVGDKETRQTVDRKRSEQPSLRHLGCAEKWKKHWASGGKTQAKSLLYPTAMIRFCMRVANDQSDAVDRRNADVQDRGSRVCEDGSAKRVERGVRKAVCGASKKREPVEELRGG